MGTYGGDGGGYGTSSTASEPWDVQGNYLQPLFRSQYAAMYGYKPDPQGGLMELSDEDRTKYYNQFYGVDAAGKSLPGKLDYFGAGDTSQGTNRWKSQNQVIDKYAPNAPTVAGFSPEQLAAQSLITGRLQGRGNVATPLGFMDTGYNTLIPSSISAYENIMTGRNKINPASMGSTQVAPNLTINAPQIGSTDLGYRYWNQLGNMAGGSNQNPYLESMINRAKSGVSRDYYESYLPTLDTDAQKAGVFGGNNWANLRDKSYDTYLRNLGDVETGMRGQAYNTNQANALSAMGLGGELASSQGNIDANRAMQQANLGLTAQTSQAGNELQRAIQNADNQQEAQRTNAGYQQQANIGNISNILTGAPQAPGLGQSSYEDISKLAAVGESNTNMAQRILDAYINFANQKQYEPYEREILMSNLLSGNFGGTSVATADNAGSGGYM